MDMPIDTKQAPQLQDEMLIERFSKTRRIEHAFVILTFSILVLTGFPQRFYEAPWATWVLGCFGGLDSARSIHRVAGFVFTGHAVLHIFGICVGLISGKMRPSLLPVTQDLRDARDNLSYYLGYRRRPPEFPKFDYRQKFEYLGIVLGSLVMIASGLVLYFPVVTAALLPGEVIPAARVAHSNEAMLALLVLVVWHLYGSCLSPEVWPLDRTMITGHMTLKELREHHGREYRRLFGEHARPETPSD